MLDQAYSEVLVQSGVDFLGQNWVDPMGPGRYRHATFRDLILDRHQRGGTNIRLGLGANVSKITENIS